MKLKSILLAAAFAAFMTTSAFGALSLSASFTLIHSGGTDPEGFNGSTWTFQFNSSQTNYSNVVGFAGVVTDSAFLTVSGAGTPGYNGTFAITDTNTTNFASLPTVFTNAYFGINSGGDESDFTFGPGPIGVSGLTLAGSPLASKNPGDLIELTDWQGMSVSDTVVTVGSGTFNFGSGTINAVVPEPSTTAALVGIAALAFVVYRRRKA